MIHVWVTPLLHTALSAIVYGAVGIFVTAPLKSLWDRHVIAQEKIADQLDTSTPGGLHDLNETLKSVYRGPVSNA